MSFLSGICTGKVALDRSPSTSQTIHLRSNIKHRAMQKMASTIPHFLLPRGSLILRDQSHILPRTIGPAHRWSQRCQYATASASSKPRVLEKPDKFRPPSHGRRLKEHLPKHYGPELTATEKVVQKTKQYPNMFPPEGSFMFWFLTNTSLHMFITLVGQFHKGKDCWN